MQLHVVADHVGHAADAEGRAALDAWKGRRWSRRGVRRLAAKYLDSPRITSYRVGAGEKDAAVLPGSRTALRTLLGQGFPDEPAAFQAVDEKTAKSPALTNRSRRPPGPAGNVPTPALERDASATS